MKKLLLTIFVLLFTISPVLAQECRSIHDFIAELEANYPKVVRHVMTDEQLNHFNQSEPFSDYGVWWTHPARDNTVYIATSISECILADGIIYNKEEFYTIIERN